MTKEPEYYYEPITEPDIALEWEKIEKLWDEFEDSILFELGIKEEDFNPSCCRHTMTKVIKRIHRSKDRFRRFNKGIQHLSEPKKAAFYAYWINKLKPYFVENKDFGEKINVMFAVFFIVKTLTFTQEEYKNDGKDFSIHTSEKFVDSLSYSMQFQNVTENILILLIESIAFEVEK